MKQGILLIGHGSRLIFNKSTMDLQAKNLREMGYENVYIGYNETSMPSIQDAMIEMAEDGIDDVVALPFFIASGLHMTRDIPPKLGLSDGEKETVTEVNGKKMKVHFETPFGEDENLTQMLYERIEELKTPEKNSAVLVMGHGSRLDYNMNIMKLNQSRLIEKGIENTFIGFNEFNEPKIENMVDTLVSEGYDEIIALPLFIASGAHLSEDIPAKLGIPQFTSEGEIEREGKKAVVKYATPVGADPRLIQVLDKKIQKYN